MNASGAEDAIPMPVNGTETAPVPENVAAEAKKPITFEAIRNSPAFLPGIISFVAIVVLLWPLWPKLTALWTSPDGYYSHGFLVPVISGYVIFRWWPRLSQIPVKPAMWAILPLAVVLWTTFIGNMMVIDGLMSVNLMAILALGVLFVAGWRWMLATLPSVLYLAFGLPLWTSLVNNLTNPLQLISTNIAFEILRLCGFNALIDQNTVIYMNSYRLDVAVPCSGLKLVVALTAFTVFFVMIGRLKMMSNFILLAMVLPLAILINGLRIAFIGMVGETNGADAAHSFHDWSGYITLVICFFILFKIARILGWKD